ncbi:ABC-type sugar transport system, ATPase component [Vulcanisaeta moutnovskia 768-28]|uniref:ABC-type sugar transport system, ATPase component n=1 Tax=Vulcanisaeta moutnovskia (strain 768-28) TaxID=985053 RepID=F0QYM1_VULM7|nr:sugar ABC transporter ATP-binding protein [Vulcanisaeta moutnovskia]ADY01454.1 ABC-type sugar transport system, ATPase component [Vulcanisaeta moutnovskia 768-28]
MMPTNANNEDNVLLLAENITKRFPGTVALDNVTFDLKYGEVHGLLGQNGAGKSTLLKILYGYYKPDNGKIIIQGRETRFRNTADARKYGIILVNQEITLMPHLAVYENIALLGFLWGKAFSSFNKNNVKYQIKDLMDKYGIELNPELKVRELNAANKMLVQILAALSMNAKVILFDEPTSPMSLRETEQILDVIRSLKKSGISITFVTHKIQEAIEICDRITVLRNGKAIGTVNNSNITEKDLAEMMLGTKLKEFYLIKEDWAGNAIKERKKSEIPLIELQDVYTVPIKLTDVPLKGVNMKIYDGEVIAVFGLIGAGKSELGRLLVGLGKIIKGRILYYGKSIKIKSPTHALEKYKIAYLPEDRKTDGIIPHYSVASNISVSALFLISKAKFLLDLRREHDLATTMIRSFNIRTASPYVKITSLSGGNQQKTLVARGLASRAKLLIIDEPTVGVDIGAKIEIRKTIYKLSKEDNISVLVLTSDLDEALGIADRLYFMHEGTVLKEYIIKSDNVEDVRKKVIEDLAQVSSYI